MRLCETTWDSETAERVQALLKCPIPCSQGCPYVRDLPDLDAARDDVPRCEHGVT